MRDYWQPDKLLKAAQLLTDAERNLHTAFPNSKSLPEPTTIPAVQKMIEQAVELVRLAQPESKP